MYVCLFICIRSADDCHVNIGCNFGEYRVAGEQNEANIAKTSFSFDASYVAMN